MKRILSAIAVVLALALAGGAHAQKYPERPVRIVVPFPPGGNVDIGARIIAQALQEELGQPFVVENKAGFAGMIGGDFVVKSKPDGYTLLVGSNSVLATSPLVFPNAPYDPVRDLAGISSLAFTPMVVVVNPGVAVNSMRDLVALAKREEGKVSMTTPSSGSINHLATEMFQSATGTKFNIIHYKGNAPATADMIAGHAQGGFDQLTSALAHIKSGKLRALAVTSERRAADLPDVPTIAEAGFAGQEAVTYTGITAPKATPPEVIARLNAAVVKALALPNVKERFAAAGAQARGSTAEEFDKFLREEKERWGPVIRGAGIKPG